MSPLFEPKHLRLTKHSTHVGGLRVTYWMSGEREAAPIIMLHGLGGSHHGLLPLAQRLRDGHQLFIPDMPGHGESSIPERASISQLAEWFAAYVRMIGAATKLPPTIIAHSFGAQVAFKACRLLGDDYNICILLAPVPRVSTLPYLVGKAISWVPSGVMVNLGRNQQLRHLRGSYLLVRRSPDVDKLVRWVGDECANTPERLSYYVRLNHRILGERTYNKSTVRKGRFYCVLGDTDKMVGAKGIARLRKVFPHRRIFICKHTGHLLPIEAPNETAALIKPLLP